MGVPRGSGVRGGGGELCGWMLWAPGLCSSPSFQNLPLCISTVLITLSSKDLCLPLPPDAGSPWGRDKNSLAHLPSPPLPSTGPGTQQVLNQNVPCV